MITGNLFIINNTSWVYDLTNRYMAALRGHKYHILSTSSSPLTISFALLFLLLVFVFNFHGSKVQFSLFDILVNALTNSFFKKIFNHDILELYFNFDSKINFLILPEFFKYKGVHLFWISPFLLTLGIFFLWSANAISEGTTVKVSFLNLHKNTFNYAGKIFVEPMFHTNLVRKGFKIGFILFIISEVMFFFGFFWGFFHSSISPTIQIGAVWPPLDVDFITVKGFAIANTVILLTSGATLTVAHYALELIPQKKNRLYKNNTLYTNSEESFVGSLNDIYSEINNNNFDATKTEIYLNHVFYKLKNEFMGGITINDNNFKFVLPIKILFNPFSKHFSWNFSLLETEKTVRLYINLMLDLTLLLALLFMVFQGTEYFISPVNINTGIYGSTFYMITGLHGAHVFIGTCFLLYCRTAVAPARNIRSIFNHLYLYFTIKARDLAEVLFAPKAIILLEKEQFNFNFSNIFLVEEENNPIDHYGKFGIESFESAAWYWHFVDVVWIFVFGFVYVWSHLTVLEQQ